MTPLVSHTLTIFNRLYRELPPLVSVDIRDSMGATLEECKKNEDLTLEDLEDTMIIFGKETWPYREAFREHVSEHKQSLLDRFFQGRLPLPLLRRYREFQAHGGEIAHVGRGVPASFFTEDDQDELRTALIGAQTDVRHHAHQAVLSVERQVYEGRIATFRQILENIETEMGGLRSLAARQEHRTPDILAAVRALEYGFCDLGDRISYETARQAKERFYSIYSRHRLM